MFTTDGTAARSLGRPGPLGRARLLLAALAVLLAAWPAFAPPFLRVMTWRLDFAPIVYTNLPLARYPDRQLRDAANHVRSQNADILLLTGVRDRGQCDRLANLLKPENYHIAVCSKFQQTADPGDSRQVAILTRLPAVVVARAEDWRDTTSNGAPGGFACAVLQSQTNTYYCYAVQMPGDPSLNPLPEVVASAQREQATRYLIAHVARLESRVTNRTTAVIFAGDFHSDAQPLADTAAPRLLEQAGFRSVFHNVAMPNRLAAPARTTDTEQFFDTIVVRGADFLNVPQIGGIKLTWHLPVSCELAPHLHPRPGPDPIIDVNWPRLGAALAAPYRALPPTGQQAAQWAALLIAMATLTFFGVRLVRRRRAPRSATALAVAGPPVPQIAYPRPTGDDVFVAESVDLRGAGAAGQTSNTDALFWQMRALEAEERLRHTNVALRSRAVPEMFRLMKDKVLAMLGAQRARLIDSHETGTRHVLQLEQRLEQIHQQFQDNLRARDRRIAELQDQIAARDQTIRTLLDQRQGKPLNRPIHD